MKHEEHVIIDGLIFPYAEKEPFGDSGKSIWGGIEYNKSRDKLKCHECGELFDSIGAHVAKSHRDISVSKYRERHVLGNHALCSFGMRKKLSSAGKTHSKTPEQFARVRSAALVALQKRRGTPNGTNGGLRNKKGTCPTQLQAKIARLNLELGRTATSIEAKAAGIKYSSHVKFNDLQASVGASPRPIGKRLRERVAVYAQGVLIELLRDFWVNNNRLPDGRDFKSRALPSRTTFCRVFGTMANAYLAAGLINPGIRNIPAEVLHNPSAPLQSEAAS